MRILLINGVCGIKSTGRICTDLAQILEKHGHEVKIGYGRETVPDQYQKYAVRIGSNVDVCLHGAKARLFDADGFGSRRATKKFLDWVKQYDPDVIHLHNLHGYYINLPLLFEYIVSHNKRVIWTLHDCWTFTGHCSHFDFIGCDKWKSGGCRNCPQKSSYPKSLFLDRSKKNYAEKKRLFTVPSDMTIVTPSEWLKSIVGQSYLSKYPTMVVNNGINTAVFKPTMGDFIKSNGLENKKIVLGVASAWDKRKGLYDFVKLSELLSDEFKVVLVGVSEAQRKKLPPSILAIGRTNNVTELAEIYSSAHVFVNTTYEDTYPTVNLEAIACHTPVISYKTGGSVESTLLFGGKCVEKGDLTALVQAIRTLDTAPKPIDAVQRKELDASTATEKYLKVYSQIHN